MVRTPQPIIEPPRSEPVGVEKAKRFFGENFLGEEAIHTMENKLRGVGVNVKFEIPQVTFAYSEADLEKARQDESQGRSRMMVLRPEWMVVKEGNRDVRKPVNILNLRDLFKKATQDSSGISVTYDNNPFGDGAIFYEQDWYNNEDFAKQSLKAGYAMPTKEVIPNSTSTTWDDQQALLESGERRREANETVWDIMFYYASTGKKVLEDHYDWTSSRASDGLLVFVGVFDSDGLDLDLLNPSSSHAYLGVCPSR